MPSTDPMKRYLDAGLEFTEITRKRAEKIVKDLVKAGEVQREQAQQRVEELVERSREASTAFAEAVRKEVTRQLIDLGLVDAKTKTPSAAAAPPVKKAATGAKATTEKAAATAKAAPKKATTKATAAPKKAAGAAKATTKKAGSAAKASSKS